MRPLSAARVSPGLGELPDRRGGARVVGGGVGTGPGGEWCEKKEEVGGERGGERDGGREERDEGGKKIWEEGERRDREDRMDGGRKKNVEDKVGNERREERWREREKRKTRRRT